MARTAILALCVGGLLNANGVIIPPHPPFPPQPPHLPPPPRMIPAAAKDVRLVVEIADQVARTQVEEVFENPNPQPLEGTFVLPIPPDAQISDFTFFIDGKEVKGEILPREKAQQYYQEIVSRLIDPGLLEYMDKGLIRVKLFPIPPRGEAKIRFSYAQILASEGEQLAYYYPFGTNKFSSRPLNQAVVDIKIASTVPLRAIYSPRYEIDVARNGEKEARVSFEKKNFTPEEDFLLYVGRSEADFGVTAVAYRSGGEDGYLLLVVSPKQEFGPAEVVAKDIVFVLDTSGSMAGEKLAQAKEALAFCVRSLGEKDRFNLIPFSTQAQLFRPALSDAAEANRAAALEFIKNLQPIGGTNIDEALALAVRQSPGAPDRPFMVVFLTDGQPTVGVTDIAKIIKDVEAARPAGLRLFVFGVGDDVNTVLLDRLAEENRGTRQYVRPKENLEVRLSSFYQQIARPVLSDVAISFSKGGTYDIYPPKITDVFFGKQIIMVGRYREIGDQIFQIAGKSGAKEYSYRFPIALPADDARASYLPRLWATRKIGYLLDEIRLKGQTKELVDEVEALAKRFGIVTPYTSYLVLEDRVVAGAGPRWGPRAGFRSGAGGGDRAGLTQEELREAGRAAVEAAAQAPAAGAEAVDSSVALRRLKEAQSELRFGAPAGERSDGAEPAAPPPLKYVGSKTFYLRGEVWQDSIYKEGMQEKRIAYLSPEYFALLAEKPELGKYFALGKDVIVCLDGVAYRIGEKVGDSGTPSSTSGSAVQHD